MAKFEVTLSFKNRDEKVQRVYEVELPSSATDGELKRAALDAAKETEDKALVEKFGDIYLSFYRRI